jgi:hypothetical protein
MWRLRHGAGERSVGGCPLAGDGRAGEVVVGRECVGTRAGEHA